MKPSTAPFIRLIAVAALAAAVAGCAAKPPAPKFPPLSFAHLTPIRLDIASIEVINAYRAPAKKPNVEHLFPIKPVDPAMRWGMDRIMPVGAAGVARVTVKRASVVEVSLKRTTGIRGSFTTDQTERYDGVVEMTVVITDGRGRERGRITSRTERTKSVPEDITLNDRDKVWYELTRAMMNDLNTSLENQIRKHLAKFVR